MSLSAGDRVTLRVPLGSCLAGDEGVVVHVGQDVNVVVRITHVKRPDCRVHQELLPPQPPDCFQAGAVCGP